MLPNQGNAKCPSKAAPMRNEIDFLAKTTDQITTELKRLAERLVPITRNVPIAEMEKQPSEPLSSMPSEIRNIREKLETILIAIQYQIDNLEV
jgi:hypothetical protein